MNGVIPVFIGSPSDVTPERRHCERAVQALAPTLAEVFGVTLVPLLWEQFAPISSPDAGHPQLEILRRMEPSSIFVGLLWRKYGTAFDADGRSGTDVEYGHALKNRDRISILSYFRDPNSGPRLPANTEAKEQLKKVLELKKQLKEQKVWSVTYKTPQEFLHRIGSDILEAALKIALAKEPTRLRNYVKFFRFGESHRTGERPILIVYPPLTRDPSSRDSGVLLNWQERFLPRVVFEDAKAIQDVEAVMRALNRRYRTLTIGSPELPLEELGDRVWICIPRNPAAQKVLDAFRKADLTRVRFRFERRPYGKREELILLWRDSKGDDIVIRSPLAKYLRYSRRPLGLSEWQPIYGYTFARDYAVFARFRIRPENAVHEREIFYHYFIGGIRGLGTWGAGWFIDHRSKQLAESVSGLVDPDEDVQLLLEVTYQDYRIKDVRIVSDEPAEYFSDRYGDQFIQNELRELEAKPLLLAFADARRPGARFKAEPVRARPLRRIAARRQRSMSRRKS